MYDNMQVVATACDGISECAGNTDEASCGDKSYGTIVSAVMMLVLFIVMQMWDYCRKDGNSETGEKKIEINMETTHHENDEIDMVTANVDMLHVLFTQEKPTRIKEGKAFYDRLAGQCLSLIHI